MSLNLALHEKCSRILGIVESFVKGVSEKSILVGVVIKADMGIDNLIVARVTAGKMDTTEKIIMCNELDIDNINLLKLKGYDISLYNVIELNRVAEETS